VLDLLLLGPVVAVIGAAVLVVRREHRPAAIPVAADDPVVDLAFLRAAPREIDLRTAEVPAAAGGSLGARLRDVQLAAGADHRPTVRLRRRRERPLFASR